MSTKKERLWTTQVTAPDSIAIYERAILGKWTWFYVPDGTSHTVEFRSTFYEAAHIFPRKKYYPGSGPTYCPNSRPVGDHCETHTKWSVYKKDGRYYLEDGTPQTGRNLQKDPLTMPPTGFTVYWEGAPHVRLSKQ